MFTIAAIGGYSIFQIAIAIIFIIAVVAIVLAYTKHAGVQIPPFITTVFWIVVFAAVAIVAIRFLFSL
jgi:hypothetical protein